MLSQRAFGGLHPYGTSPRDGDPKYFKLLGATHYYDCQCYECTDAHFPCDDLTCMYCDTIRTIKDSAICSTQLSGTVPQSIWNSPVPIVKKEVGGIIGYSTFNAWPDDYEFGYNDLLWSECDNCDILISGYERDTFNDHCSADCNYNICCDCSERIDSDDYRCESCQIQHDTYYYCRVCGDEKVRYAGEICNYCDEDEHNNNDIDDGSGYLMADVVDLRDYKSTPNCWIDPSGRVRYVPYCNHQTTAQKLGFDGVTQAESRGYIHVSNYWDEIRPFKYIPDR